MNKHQILRSKIETDETIAGILEESGEFQSVELSKSGLILHRDGLVLFYKAYRFEEAYIEEVR